MCLAITCEIVTALDIFFFLSPVTVPQVFAKNNSAHFYSVDLTGSYNFCLQLIDET